MTTARQIKINGIHYTPPELANFLANVALAALSPTANPIEVLDPACGNGSLSFAIAELAPAFVRERLVVTGYETDPLALCEAQRNLNQAGMKSVMLRELDLSIPRNFRWAQGLGWVGLDSWVRERH